MYKDKERCWPLFGMVWVSTITVFGVFFNVPSSYYMTLRLIVSITAVVGIVTALLKNDTTWPWIYGVVAIFFNPIIPIHLYSKEAWIVIDIITLALFWIGLYQIDKKDWPKFN